MRLSLLTIAAACFLTPAVSFADEPEVLARGPIHEAYAQPTDQQPAPGPVLEKEPPAPIEELPPDQKPEGENVQWMPGYWSFDEDRKDYIWISGFWRVSPPNRVWVPGGWRKVQGGYQWVGGFWAPNQPAPQPMPQGQPQGQPQAQVEYLPQPPQPIEVGPATPAPAADAIYVPGCWVYRERYVWRPGFWQPYRANWIWTPANYRWTPAGYVFIDGYWDYPLADRGLLFAPVYVPPAVYLAPNYVYTPTVIVREPALFGALFVRHGYGAYYFGDYFAPRYSGLGFTSWIGYRSGPVAIGVGFGAPIRQRNFYDPLYSYYSVSGRNDPYWRNGIHNQYDGRYRGTIAAPPRTLVQQNTTINNITINNPAASQAALLSPLATARETTNVRLTNVTPEARREQALGARSFRDASAQRSVAETNLVNTTPAVSPANVANPTAPATPRQQPRTAQLNVARPATIRVQTDVPVTPKGLDPVQPPKNVDPGTPRGNPGTVDPVTPLPKVNPVTPLPKGNQKNADPVTPQTGGNPRNIDPGTPRGNPGTVDPVTPLPKVNPVTPLPKGNQKSADPVPPVQNVNPVLPMNPVQPKLVDPVQVPKGNPNAKIETPKVNPPTQQPLPSTRGNPNPDPNLPVQPKVNIPQPPAKINIPQPPAKVNTPQPPVVQPPVVQPPPMAPSRGNPTQTPPQPAVPRQPVTTVPQLAPPAPVIRQPVVQQPPQNAPRPTFTPPPQVAQPSTPPPSRPTFTPPPPPVQRPAVTQPPPQTAPRTPPPAPRTPPPAPPKKGKGIR